MSKRVIFTCSLLMILGVAGGLDSAAAFSRGQVHVNLLVLLLPVSIALFMAAPGARLAATVVLAVLYLFLATLLFPPFMGAADGKVQVLPSQLPLQSSFPVILVFVSMFGSLLALLHWMLFSPPFEEHLNP